MTRAIDRWAVRLAPPALAVSLMLSGCAVYSPVPLPEHAQLAASTPAPASESNVLDMDQVSTLAVLNNPDLQAERAKLHVAQAQAFAAGLLPDPQLGWTTDHPTDHVSSSGDPRYPEYTAYGLSLTVDLQALLTHVSAHAAADAAYQQARLDLLWQEWQTVAQARTLYIELSLARTKVAFLAQAEQDFGTESASSQRALQAGDVALDLAGADLAALTDIRTQLGTARRDELHADSELHTLLGLQSAVTLNLQPLGTPALPDRAALQQADLALPQTRPDLKALQAGYRSQEALVHKAVLSQFPNVSVGATRARDTSDVHSTGFGVTLTLPLFERGRGDIAIQRATREQLRAEYLARLDEAEGEVWQVWNEMQVVQDELQSLGERLPHLEATAARARSAYGSGDLPVATYLTMFNAYIAGRTTESDLVQSLWSDSIALATVLGTQVQPVIKP